MTSYERDYTDRLHQRLRVVEAEKRILQRRLVIIETLAALGWLIVLLQAAAAKAAAVAPAVLGVTFRLIMIGCGVLTVAGWWL